MSAQQVRAIAEKYASDFLKAVGLSSEIEQRCEWSCLLWSREYWASKAKKAKINLQHAKEHLSDSPENAKILIEQMLDSQFLNAIAQVYSKLFDGAEQSCTMKNFANCPFMSQRGELLRRGLLASTFATFLQQATFFAMREHHPLDSGLINEEYQDVYGIDLTDFGDLEDSLTDGRFAKLFEAMVNRIRQLRGIRSDRHLCG